MVDELDNEATTHANAHHRTSPKQIEYWARIGILADENPDLPLGFVRHTLIALEEEKSNDVTEYKFG